MARRDAVAQSVLQADSTTNLSLWLDRYTWGFEQEIVRQHHAIAVDRIRAPEGYARAFQRRKLDLAALFSDFAGGETWFFDLKLTGRAIVGIGAASVRETNVSLLRPWGVPFIPGSALKGLASHVAHAAGGAWARPSEPGARAGALQRAIFGDVTSAGAVVFHDAWWMPSGDRMPIDADVMTVHHPEYYQATSPPADWDEPNPVSFLTVRDRYLAALTGPKDALEVAEVLLRDGLKNLGIGAKTAAGYGRAALERQLSNIARAFQGFAPGTAAANTVQQHAHEFLRLARQAQSSEDERIAAEVAKRMVSASPAVWKKWVESAARTDEERRWFQAALPEPKMPEQALAVAPARGEEVKAAIERRRARVTYIQDKKAKARYYLRIEGERKDIKGHLLAISSEDLERVKAAGEEGAVLELEYENGRLRLRG